VLDLAQDLRRLGTELYASGGATVDTTDAGTHRQPEPGAIITARTVIQPDGDVVCFATHQYCEDAELRGAHRTLVSDWYRSAESTVTTAAAALGVVSAAFGAAVGTLAGGVSGAAASRPWGLAVGSAVGAAVVVVASLVVSTVLHSRLRRLGGRLLGGR